MSASGGIEMSIFQKYTRRSLRENPTRTIVTIIGIVLSMALFTAVCEGAWSGICFMRDNEIAQSGSWHGFVRNLSPEEEETLANNPKIQSTAKLETVGIGEFATGNSSKPYIQVDAMGQGFENLVVVNLAEGRLPENPGEIILPSYMINNGASLKLGQTLTLNLGERYQDGEKQYENSAYREKEEEIRGARPYTYTLVGFYERLDYAIDDYVSPACLGLTCGTGTVGNKVFFTVYHPSQFYKIAREELNGLQWTGHRSLLAVVGGIADGNISNMVSSLAAILVIMVFVGSVTLIYNSFSISVTERVKQFGILKSIGATKKQIRACVLYEALFLTAIAIPIGLVVGCLGIGVTLYCLRDAFAKIMFATAVPMRLVVNLPTLLLASGVCVVTALVSAWIPARKAVETSPMESIRQTQEIRLRQKDVKTSRLTGKLFGFPGMMAAKNFKRNHRRCRAVVLSLTLSITLFVSAYAFSDGLMGTSSVLGEADAVDITYYYVPKDMNTNLTQQALMELFRNAQGVEEVTYQEMGSMEMHIPQGALAAGNQDDSLYLFVCFLDDDSFRALCASKGEKPETYFASAKALFFNLEAVETENGIGKKFVFQKLLDDNAAPLTITGEVYRKIDGYDFIHGEDELIYYPVEMLYGSEEKLDESKGIHLTMEEATIRWTFDIEHIVSEKAPREVSYTLYYPLSMKDAVLGENAESWSHNSEFRMIAPDHATVYNNLKKALLAQGERNAYLYDQTENRESEQMMLTVIRVFSYGFIILISLIAAANIFNTISTNVNLRRREFAMLRSVGMSPKEFRRMMTYECLEYGAKGLAWGLPLAVICASLIYRVMDNVVSLGVYVPWNALLIAVLSVFLVVGASTLYAGEKVRRENILDALKNENA